MGASREERSDGCAEESGRFAEGSAGGCGRFLPTEVGDTGDAGFSITGKGPAQEAHTCDQALGIEDRIEPSEAGRRPYTNQHSC